MRQHGLEGFAHHIAIGPGIFAGAGIGMMTIALLTVGYQSIRAALADPVDTLWSE